MPDVYDDGVANCLRLLRQAMARNDRAAVATAVDGLRFVTVRAGSSHPHRGIFLTNVSSGLVLRYRLSQDVSDLDEAIGAGLGALATNAVPEPQRGALVAQLNRVQTQRIELHGLPDDLTGAVRVFRAAVDGVRDPATHLARYLVAKALIIQHEQTGPDSRGLDDAIDLMDGIVAATGADEMIRVAALTGSTNGRRMRFETRGDRADLSRAIETAREAAHARGQTAENQVTGLSNLSTILRLNALYGAEADITEAVDAGRRAAALSPDPSRRVEVIANLGIVLRTHFELRADAASLNEAIKLLRGADRTAPPDHSDRPRWLCHLAIALLQRFLQLGEPADLDDAIGCGDDALAKGPEGHHDRLAMLDLLSCAYLVRFRDSGVPGDLGESVRRATEAVDSSPRNHPQRPGYVGNLSIVARSQFTVTRHRPDLDTAIRYGREAYATIRPGHAARPAVLVNLCEGLLARFDDTLHGPDIDESVQVGEEAVRITARDHPSRAGALDSLASARQRRFRHRAARADADRACEAWDEAAGSPTGNARTRILAAYEAAELCASSDWRSWPQVLTRFASAVHLLPLLGWRGVSRAGQDRALAAWPSVGRDAAACAVLVADPARSVALLEQGRTVRWTQLLELRTDLDALSRTVPRVASRLDEIRRELDRPPVQVPQGH